MKKTLITILFISSVSLFAESSIDKTQRLEGKPVDEGHKLVYQEDKTKGTEDVDNSYQYKTLSLKELKTSLTIERKDISYAPFKLLKYNDKSKKIETIATEEKALNSINFNIKTSTLKEGDRLLVINNNDSNQENSPEGKEVIIEIEILK